MNLSPFQQTLLYGIAFTNGALLMGMEILGSRILAPVLGNSIFVWGSLIGVFMGGMAVGYYVGGWLGDRAPRRSILALLLGFSALYLFLLPFWGTPVCTLLADLDLDPRTTALITSLLLFFPPSLSMGAVSPFLFVFLFRGRQHAGRSVGTLYAVSTIGSIAGTIGTAFFLILWLGTRSSLFLIGGGMALLAILAATLLPSVQEDESRD